MMKILITDNKKDEDFLRKKLGELDLKKEDPKELRQLGRNMRKTMNEASGIGLSANQVGVSKRLFVAQVPDKEGVSKFYVVINPKIIKKSSETSGLEEGCLSIPKKFGMVERPTSIMVEGFNISAKKIKIKAWGLLARVFQHEIDHLDGVLFVDKATEIREATDEEGSEL